MEGCCWPLVGRSQSVAKCPEQHRTDPPQQRIFQIKMSIMAQMKTFTHTELIGPAAQFGWVFLCSLWQLYSEMFSHSIHSSISLPGHPVPRGPVDFCSIPTGLWLQGIQDGEEIHVENVRGEEVRTKCRDVVWVKTSILWARSKGHPWELYLIKRFEQCKNGSKSYIW